MIRNASCASIRSHQHCACVLLVLDVELGLWVLIISRLGLVAVRAPGEALLGSISNTWGEAWLMGSSLQSSL